MTDADQAFTVHGFDYADEQRWRICPVCHCLVPGEKRQVHLDYHAWEASR